MPQAVIEITEVRWHAIHISGKSSCRGKNLPTADNQNNSTKVTASAELSSSSVGTDCSRHSVASVKVSVTAVMLTELTSFPHFMERPMFVVMQLIQMYAGQVISQCQDHIFKDLFLLKFTDPDTILSTFSMVINHAFSFKACWLHLSYL
jgi:urate oxidase